MCEKVGYKLSPANGWTGGVASDEEQASEWIKRLAANADTCSSVR